METRATYPHKPMIYKNYECYRNRLTRHFYAYPINSITTEMKLTAATPDELKRAIDEATALTHSLNPWELPSTASQPIAA